MFQLRDYQVKAIDDIYQLFKMELTSVLLYAPTGAGKTALLRLFLIMSVKASAFYSSFTEQNLSSKPKTKKQKFYGIEAVLFGLIEASRIMICLCRWECCSRLNPRELPEEDWHDSILFGSKHGS